jgi:hypothetical protein
MNDDRFGGCGRSLAVVVAVSVMVLSGCSKTGSSVRSHQGQVNRAANPAASQPTGAPLKFTNSVHTGQMVGSESADGAVTALYDEQIEVELAP